MLAPGFTGTAGRIVAQLQIPAIALRVRSLFLGFTFHGIPFRQHTFVQDAGYENASRVMSEKYDVLALFHTSLTGRT